MPLLLRDETERSEDSVKGVPYSFRTAALHGAWAVIPDVRRRDPDVKLVALPVVKIAVNVALHEVAESNAICLFPQM